MRPRILIADDHTLVADLCKKLLETEFEVVSTVDNGRAMVEAALNLKPDLIVVDIGMPVLNGLDAGQRATSSLDRPWNSGALNASKTLPGTLP